MDGEEEEEGSKSGKEEPPRLFSWIPYYRYSVSISYTLVLSCIFPSQTVFLSLSLSHSQTVFISFFYPFIFTSFTRIKNIYFKGTEIAKERIFQLIQGVSKRIPQSTLDIQGVSKRISQSTLSIQCISVSVPVQCRFFR